MTTYISAETAGKLAKLVLICFGLILAVIIYVLWQSYEGRANLITQSRAACERGKEDRNISATGWRIEQSESRANGDILSANQFDKIASHLEERGRIDCNTAFPKASLIP